MYEKRFSSYHLQLEFNITPITYKKHIRPRPRKPSDVSVLRRLGGLIKQRSTNSGISSFNTEVIRKEKQAKKFKWWRILQHIISDVGSRVWLQILQHVQYDPTDRLGTVSCHPDVDTDSRTVCVRG